jgi:ligand-binding sensor domain-containing protein
MTETQGRDVAVRIAKIAAGILIVIGILVSLQLLLGFLQVKNAPEGWHIIRPPGEVYTILIENNTVWTGGKDGVILIDRITGRNIPLPGSPPPVSYVRSIVRDRQGSIWIAHDGGIVRYRNGVWEVIAPQDDVPFTKTLSLIERRDGTIVAGTIGGVYFSDGLGWKSLMSPSSPSIATADALFEDGDGNLWVGSISPTLGGLYRLNGTTWESFTGAEGLLHESSRAMMQDKEGAIWVATGFANTGGAAIYRNGTWSNLTVEDGLAGRATRVVYQDRMGRMWVGSEYDGIAVLDHGSWHVLTTKEGLAGQEVKFMTEDKDNTFWLGTNGGLNRIERNATLFR